MTRRYPIPDRIEEKDSLAGVSPDRSGLCRGGSAVRNRRSVGLRLMLALALLGGALSACDTSMSTRTADGTSDETHSSVDIAGRVVDDKGAPLPGIVVATQRLGLSDTTDASGRYRIQADRIPGSPAGRTASRLGEVPALDTLIVRRNGSELARLPVPRWVVTLADIVVGFRELRGLLTGDGTRVDRVEAVIRGPGLRLRRVGLAVDTSKGAYSGGFEFASFGGSGEVAVELQAIGADSTVLSSSGILPVPAQGEIVVPPLAAGESERSVRIVVDGPVYEGDTIRLHAETSGAFEGGIASWEWKIFGSPQYSESIRQWHATPGPDRELRQMLGDTTRQWICWVRARDAHGNVAVDSLRIDVQPLPYRWIKLYRRNGDMVGIPAYVGEPLPFNLVQGGTPEHGVKIWEWKLGEGEWTIGGARDSIVVPTRVDSAFRVAVRITDNLLHVYADSIEFHVLSGAFRNVWDFEDPRTSPVPGFGDDTTLRVFSNSKSTAKLEWNADSPLEGAKDLKFTFALADEGQPGAFDSYAGFDLLLDHGRPVDLTYLARIDLQTKVTGTDSGFSFRVMVLSPENPDDSTAADGFQGLLGANLRLPRPPQQVSTSSSIDWSGLEWPTWAAPADVDARWARVLRKAVGLRFEVDRRIDRAGELLPASSSGSVEIDAVRFRWTAEP